MTPQDGEHSAEATVAPAAPAGNPGATRIFTVPIDPATRPKRTSAAPSEQATDPSAPTTPTSAPAGRTADDPGSGDTESGADAPARKLVGGAEAGADAPARKSGSGERYVLFVDDRLTPNVRSVLTTTPDPAPGADFPLWPDGVGTTATGTTAPTRPATAPERPSVREPRRPGTGLPLLVLLGLLAAFFGWVGAEPFWLAVGHADRGVLTVTLCTGHGVTHRCSGDFIASGHRYRVRGVALTGSPAGAHEGARVAARMVHADGRQAYAGDHLGLLLRWILPLALVLLLGLLIAAATGAWRLRGRHRAGVIGLSLLGPLILTAGLFAAAW